MIYASQLRASAQIGQQHFELCAWAFGNYLDRAVVTISHPACQQQATRHAPGVISKAHALHDARCNCV